MATCVALHCASAVHFGKPVGELYQVVVLFFINGAAAKTSPTDATLVVKHANTSLALFRQPRQDCSTRQRSTVNAHYRSPPLRFNPPSDLLLATGASPTAGQILLNSCAAVPLLGLLSRPAECPRQIQLWCALRIEDARHARL
ncbi:MAG: hypothetical protein FJW26_15795 [Acidimicrobiia bacterium]|nr:hypothetical protein [Acidimicrobiia bacterium]